MTIQINSSKSGVQNLYDLLNAANPGKGFTDANVSFGAVTVETEEDENTSVVVTALSNQGFSGSHPIYYDRLNPGTAHGKTGSMQVTISPADTQAQIKDKIIAAVGCIGADVDVIGNGEDDEFKIPENEDDTSCTFTITAKSNSYVYVGQFTAYLTVPDVDVPLSEAIEFNHLGGFTAG